MKILVFAAMALTQEMEPGQILLQANAAYDAGNHDEAVRLYDSLLDQGTQNGYVYFNLGNALLRRGHLGRAIATYRQAQSLLPRNSDVRANLEFARKATKDAIEPTEPSAVAQTLFFWHFSLSLRELLMLLVGINLAFWTTLVWQRARRESELLRWAVVALFLLLVTLGSSTVVRTLFPNRVAVINAYEVEVRSGLSRDTVVRFKLHQGTETKLMDVRDEWARIALPDGKQGWVLSAELLVVTL